MTTGTAKAIKKRNTGAIAILAIVLGVLVGVGVAVWFFKTRSEAEELETDDPLFV